MAWKIDFQTWLLLGSQAAFALTVYIFDLLLKNSLAKEVEGYKKDLEKALTEHQIKFSQLHADRAMVIKELYKKVVELEKMLETYLISGITATTLPGLEATRTKEIKVDFNSILNYLCNLQDYFEEIRIYLNDNIYILLQKTIEKYEIYLTEVLMYFKQESENKDNEILGQKLNIQLLKAVKEELIKEFRSLLGVN